MILGIDIGTYSVKIVGIEKTKNHYSVKIFGSNLVVKDFKSYDPDKITASNWSAAIQDLCSSLKININKVEKVVSSISGQYVVIKPMTLLEMEGAELLNTLTFEAKKHVPLDGSDPIVDYHIIGQDSKQIDKINLLLVASTMKIIKHSSANTLKVGRSTENTLMEGLGTN